jgi:TIGR03009 family protein
MSVRALPLVAILVVSCLLVGAPSAVAQPLAPVPGVQPQQPGGPLPLPQMQAPQAPPQPQIPFTLSPEDQAAVDRLLIDWQNMSGQVKTFEAEFDRFDYDGVFGNGNDPKRIVPGVLKYAAPDKGYYADSDKDHPEKDEKWICTGDAIFEFAAAVKQVREHPLPPAMRGKAISDGPMPFVFGVEAAKMKARYWLRITTPQEAAANKQVWLEAYPQHAKDAANFKKVDVILNFDYQNGAVTKLEPFAINMVLPNEKDRTVYRFTKMTTNGVLNNLGNFIGIFVRPATPLGWQHIVMDDTADAPGTAESQPGQPGSPAGTQPVIQQASQPAAQPAPSVGAVPQPAVPR